MAREYTLGIDVSKSELVIFDTQTKKHLKLDNTDEAIHKAIAAFNWQPSGHQVGLESTGDFSMLPMKVFAEEGFLVRLLNPILTQAGIKRTVRGIKTDATDAELIAELTAKGEGQEVTEISLNTDKKSLVRIERKLTAMASDLKRLIKAVEQKQTAGAKLSQAKSILRLLEKQTTDAAVKVWQETNNPSLNNVLNRQEEIISSHIGCGEKLSTIISEEAGDIKRFSDAHQLVAYAGIDPKVRQSGNMDIRGHMTKRGNNNLRHALYLAASVAVRFDPQLKSFFEKKRAEGKHYTLAVCAVARKMCERIYATVIENRLYEKREVLNLS